MDTFYVALYPYSYCPQEGNEVSFESGDVFLLKDNSNAEWSLVSPVTNEQNEFYVPANYIQPMASYNEDQRQEGYGNEDENVTPVNGSEFLDNKLFAGQWPQTKLENTDSGTSRKQCHPEGDVGGKSGRGKGEEHLSIDSALDGGSCDSLSTDSDLSPNKHKHADSGADSIESVSNLPTETVVVVDSNHNDTLASPRTQLQLPKPTVLRSQLYSESRNSCSYPPALHSQTGCDFSDGGVEVGNKCDVIIRPSTFMQPESCSSASHILQECTDSDEAPRPKPRTLSLVNESTTRKDSRCTSSSLSQSRKKVSLRERLSGTISHSKARSGADILEEAMRANRTASGGASVVERSSFRKSLDDLITPERLHGTDMDPAGVASIRNGNQYQSHTNMMSSNFSIATTTAAAASMDCLFTDDEEAEEFKCNPHEHHLYSDSVAVMLRSGSLGCFATPHASSNTPYAFFDVLREGVLYKKVETEHSSRSLLSWSGLRQQQGKCFVQLTERALLFFKDRKHAQTQQNSYSSQASAGGSGVAQSRPEHSFELFASNIEWRRGKKNTFQLWCDFMPQNKVLLKSSNPYDAVQWYDAINTAIVNLKTGVTKMENDFDQASLMTAAIEGSSSGTLNRSDLANGQQRYKKNYSGNFFSGPDKVVNRKSYRTQESTSSLASSGGSQTTLGSVGGMRNCLAQLLKSRPSVDALKKKGILKSAPVFGCLLEVRSESEKRMVPEFVINGTREVERRGVDIEGIYRLCGNMAEIQKLRFEVDKNSSYSLSQVQDIHVITGALKMYFRELPESLFPSGSYTTLAQAFTSGKETDELIDTVRGIIQTFSFTHQATLLHLFTHLSLVVERQHMNKMDSTNVAIVFGPNLIFPPDHISMAASVATTNSIMLFTLTHLPLIFPPHHPRTDTLLKGATNSPRLLNSLQHSKGHSRPGSSNNNYYSSNISNDPSPTSELTRISGGGVSSSPSSRVSSLHLLGSSSPWNQSPLPSPSQDPSPGSLV
ncbi:uncharacterized protein LOC134845259 isoform X2 [Symsagittifera roscoffensis]|uniref:uncharacterized protein LOC134845259 isoform X2 n=1 Tax=Symsagittifera roscoffensis TaxID=84072 RepID=UPI00307C7398